jgi:hypothetical protein
MNHQPYETWLLSEHQGTPAQNVELQQHLETCPDCRKLDAGWKEARQQIQDAALVSPRPGFTARYQASLAERQARLARLQTLRLVGGLAGGLALVSLALGVWVVFTTTPLLVLLSAVDALSQLVHAFSSFEQVVQILLSNTHPVVAVIAWILVTGWAAVLSTAWVWSVYRITMKGVPQK